MTTPLFPNDTPAPVEGGCGREGCGHEKGVHYRTQGFLSLDYYSNVPKGPIGEGPCNMRGVHTHCICYAFVHQRY